MVGCQVRKMFYTWCVPISLAWHFGFGLIYYSAICVDNLRVGFSNCVRALNAYRYTSYVLSHHYNFFAGNEAFKTSLMNRRSGPSVFHLVGCTM